MSKKTRAKDLRASETPKPEFSRKSRNLKPRELVLLLCEGETERNYFDELRQTYRLSSTEQLRNISKGTASVRLVQDAIKEAEKLRAEEPKNHQVWCVFDRDEHSHIGKAFQLAEQHGIKIAFSNPSFELWYLIHHKRQSAHIEREVVEKEVREKHGWKKPASL